MRRIRRVMTLLTGMLDFARARSEPTRAGRVDLRRSPDPGALQAGTVKKERRTP